MNVIHRNCVKLVTVFSCALVLAGCANPNLVTLSRPKIYSDSQVRKTLDERRQALVTLGTTIQDAAIQEVRGIRQAQQTAITISGQTTTAVTTQAPNIQSTPVTLPAAQAAPSGLGLGFQALLHKALERDQRLTGLQLLYLGDQEALDQKNRLLLIRFDVSLTHYKDVTTFWGGEPKFPIIGFEVKAFQSDKPDEPLEVNVYHVMPDVSSIISQESFIASQLENMSLAGAGVTGNTLIQGTASSQNALEQSFLALQEQPLEYAIYGSKTSEHSNRFGFALGPRRRIEKRIWINPARFFGNKYDLTYVLEPGPRDLYALVVVPCQAETLKIGYLTESYLQPQEFSDFLIRFEEMGIDPKKLKQQTFKYQLRHAECQTKPKVITVKSGTAKIAFTKGLISVKAGTFTVKGDQITDEKDKPIDDVTSDDVIDVEASMINYGEIQYAQDVEIKDIQTGQIEKATASSIKVQSGTITVQSGMITLNDGATIDVQASTLTHKDGTTTEAKVGKIKLKGVKYIIATKASPFTVRGDEITVDGNDGIIVKEEDQKAPEIKVEPSTIFPSLTNSLIVTSNMPVSSETQVWIGQYAVPPQNISLMGRYQLKVTVPPNDVLKSQLKTSPPKSVSSEAMEIFGNGSVHIKNYKMNLTFDDTSIIKSGETLADITGEIALDNTNSKIKAKLIGSLPAVSDEGTGSIIGEASIRGKLTVNISVTDKDSKQWTCSSKYDVPSQYGTVTASGALIVFPPTKTPTSSTLVSFTGEGNYLGTSTPLGDVPLLVTCSSPGKPNIIPRSVTGENLTIVATGTINGHGTTVNSQGNSGKGNSVDNGVNLVVAIPGETGTDALPYLSIKLTLAGGGQPSTPIVVNPTFGGPQREVTLTLSDPSVDLRKATAVKVGSEDAIIIDNSKSNEIKFLVPLLLNSPTLPTLTSIKVFLPLPQKDQVVDGIFTYFPSSPQVQKISVSP